MMLVCHVCSLYCSMFRGSMYLILVLYRPNMHTWRELSTRKYLSGIPLQSSNFTNLGKPTFVIVSPSLFPSMIRSTFAVIKTRPTYVTTDFPRTFNKCHSPLQSHHNPTPQPPMFFVFSFLFAVAVVPSFGVIPPSFLFRSVVWAETPPRTQDVQEPKRSKRSQDSRLVDHF